MKIEIFGQVCIDHNRSEQSSFTGAGSPAMFMNRIFRQFPECTVGIVSPYGPDFIPYLSGVNIYPPRPNGTQTLIYENTSSLGARTQKSFNRDQALPVPIDKVLKAKIEAADVIFFAPILPNYPPEYYGEVASFAKRGSLRFLLPQGHFRTFDEANNVSPREFEEAKRILPFIDVVIVSEQDYPNMLETAKEWCEENRGLVSIVTKGEKGAVAVKKDELIELPTKTVPEEDIVDSVGSGDIFSAGFAYRLRQIGDVKEAGRFANELARQCLFYTPDKIKVDLQKLLPK